MGEAAKIPPGVSIKLTECELDYILILIKFKGFFYKITEPHGQSEPSMRDPMAEKFPMTWFKLYGLSKCYFCKVQGDFYKINSVWARLFINFDKVRGVFIKLSSLLDNPSHPRAIRISIKLTECGLDYILILIKLKGFL